jgi:hypothetical protein
MLLRVEGEQLGVDQAGDLAIERIEEQLGIEAVQVALAWAVHRQVQHLLGVGQLGMGEGTGKRSGSPQPASNMPVAPNSTVIQTKTGTMGTTDRCDAGLRVAMTVLPSQPVQGAHDGRLLLKTRGTGRFMQRRFAAADPPESGT